MQVSTIKLEEALLTRKLVDPKKITEAIMDGSGLSANSEILNDPELLAKVVTLNNAENREALEALIRARILPIVADIITEAEPVEVLVLRQAMVEVSQILKDLDLFVAEDKRRKANEKQNNTPAVPAEVSGERKKDDESPPGKESGL